MQEEYPFKLSAGFKHTSPVIVFSSKETFERYKVEEEQYCFKEMIRLFKAITKPQREEAKKNFFVKRAIFMDLFQKANKDK